jgi:hypothetical protein
MEVVSRTVDIFVSESSDPRLVVPTRCTPTPHSAPKSLPLSAGLLRFLPRCRCLCWSLPAGDRRSGDLRARTRRRLAPGRREEAAAERGPGASSWRASWSPRKVQLSRAGAAAPAGGHLVPEQPREVEDKAGPRRAEAPVPHHQGRATTSSTTTRSSKPRYITSSSTMQSNLGLF